MIVEQLWADNPLRNYNYLIVCPETRDALAIDPLDFRQCLRVAQDRDYRITQIVNTHHHRDHIGGNAGLVEATGATLIAHADAVDKIPNVDRKVTAGDTIEVGASVVLDCLDTPGHTMSHICLLSRTDPPALFSGDTLFNAGAGNCHNGGRPEALYATFVGILAELPNDALVYPGHDYLLNNLRFTLDREPDNADAAALLEKLEDHDPTKAYITTLGEEKRINTFFRLRSPGVTGKLHDEYGGNWPAKATFLKLRELRNSW
jgi:hydroxyacylglutathione hydrolase